MSELKPEHKGKGRYNLINAEGEAVNEDWLTKEEAFEQAGMKPGKPRTRRRERVSFGQMRRQLALDDSTQERLDAAGKVPRWVNDEDDGTRLKNMHDRGYDFVRSTGDEIVGDPDGGYEPPKEGTHIKKHVGMTKGGKPMYAYLMAIDEEYRQEDLAAKEAVNMQVDTAIRGGNAPGSEKTSESGDLGRTFVKDVKYQP